MSRSLEKQLQELEAAAGVTHLCPDPLTDAEWQAMATAFAESIEGNCPAGTLEGAYAWILAEELGEDRARYLHRGNWYHRRFYESPIDQMPRMAYLERIERIWQAEGRDCEALWQTYIDRARAEQAEHEAFLARYEQPATEARADPQPEPTPEPPKPVDGVDRAYVLEQRRKEREA